MTFVSVVRLTVDRCREAGVLGTHPQACVNRWASRSVRCNENGDREIDY